MRQKNWGMEHEGKTGHAVRFVRKPAAESKTRRRNGGRHNDGHRDGRWPHRETGRASCEWSKIVARTSFRSQIQAISEF
jgi:hypothetical protein